MKNSDFIKLKIAHLSVNKCWQGRRYKTDDYKKYEMLVLNKLPRTFNIPLGKLKVHIIFGVSSKLSDVDNGIKPFLDILQKKYGFNDNKIYVLKVEKEDVEKGKEFISFSIGCV